MTPKEAEILDLPIVGTAIGQTTVSSDMTRYVAFLRSINVGGHAVKMDRLRRVFESLGFANVETFIASGNVLFESASKNARTLEGKIGATLKEALRYEMATFRRTNHFSRHRKLSAQT